MAGLIGEAVVAIHADTQGFASEADNRLSRVFRSIGDAADRAARGIVEQLGHGFERVTDQAQRSGEQIENAMSEAARSSDESLDKIGGADVWVELTEQAERAGEKIEGSMREAGRAADRALDGHGGGGGRLGGGLLAAAAGAGVLAYALKGATDAYAESQKISMVTAQLTAQTGFAANLTSVQIGDLAQSLALKTGVDDEVIQSGQNVLLTFKNVADEAGRGNDIFTRASAAALDLSTVLGGDVSSASMQLGKALNDPVKGLSVLGKAGVTFTQQQKDQVKALVESGDALSAQKIILAEVEGQVGGAAEAAANPMDRLKVVAGNLQESLGAGLVGAIAPLSEGLIGLADSLEPLLSALGGALGGALSTLAPVFAGLVEAVRPLLPVLGQVLTAVVSAFGGVVLDAVNAFVPVLTALAPAATAIANVMGDTLGTVLRALAPVFLSLAQAVTPIVLILADGFAKILDQLSPVIVIVAKAVADLAAQFGGKLGEVIGKVVPVLVEVAGVLVDALLPVLPVIVDAVSEVAGIFGDALLSVMTALAPVIRQLAPIIGELAGKLVTGLAPILPQLAQVFAKLLDAIAPLIPQLVPLVQMLGQSFVDSVTALLPALLPLVQALADLLVQLLPIIVPVLKLAVAMQVLMQHVQVTVILALAHALTAVVHAITSVVEWVKRIDFAAIPDKAKGAVDAVLRFFRELPGKAAGFLASLPDKVAELGSKLLTAGRDLGGSLLRGLGAGLSGALKGALNLAGQVASTIRNVMNKIVDKLNDAFDFTIKGPGPLPDLHVNLPDLPHFARGTIANRPTLGVFGEDGTEVLINTEGDPGRARALAAESGLLSLLGQGLTPPSAAVAAVGGPQMVDQSINLHGPVMLREREELHNVNEILRRVRRAEHLGGDDR